jgi:hypothetical protein
MVRARASTKSESGATARQKRPRARRSPGGARESLPPLAQALGRVEAHKLEIHRRERETRACIEEFIAAGGARIAGFTDDAELWDRLLRGRPHLLALLGAHPTTTKTSGAKFAASPVSERMAVLTRVVGFIAAAEAEIDRRASEIDAELEAIEQSGAWRDLLYRDFEELIEKVLGPDQTLSLLVSVGARHRPTQMPPASLRNGPGSLMASPLPRDLSAMQAPSALLGVGPTSLAPSASARATLPPDRPPAFFSRPPPSGSATPTGVAPADPAARPVLPSDPPPAGGAADLTPASTTTDFASVAPHLASAVTGTFDAGASDHGAFDAGASDHGAFDAGASDDGVSDVGASDDIAPDFSVHASAPPDFLLQALALAGPQQDDPVPSEFDNPELEHPEFFASEPNLSADDDDDGLPAFLAMGGESARSPSAGDEAEASADALVVVPAAPLADYRPRVSTLTIQLIVTALAMAIGAALGWTSIFTSPPPAHEAAPEGPQHH